MKLSRCWHPNPRADESEPGGKTPKPACAEKTMHCRESETCAPQYLGRWLATLAVAWVATASARACEMCAIYNAGSTLTGTGRGFVASVSGQFIRFGSEQLDGREVRRASPDSLDSSIAHLVLGCNFTPRIGLNINAPVLHRSFHRTDFRYARAGVPVLQTERGEESGLGDLAVIGRGTLWQRRAMDFGISLDALAGVKFPTGDTGRLRDEVEQSEIFNSFLAPGTPHDPLGHSISSVHPHDLSPGSGSYDGLFGLTLNTRWQRWFFNAQFQYALRTQGESGFRYGDELIVSGGPGAFLYAESSTTLSLQLLAACDSMARDEILGAKSGRTGSTAWYLGPQLAFTWGRHFGANAGVDVPVRIANGGFQAVPDYRIHGGVNWRF